MPIIAYIPFPEEASGLLTWARRIVAGQKETLEVWWASDQPADFVLPEDCKPLENETHKPVSKKLSANQIRKQLEEEKCSLLIITKRESARTGDPSLDLARNLFIKASCPTLILRLSATDTQHGNNILMPTAGGGDTLAALKHIAPLLKDPSSKLTLLNVQNPHIEFHEEIGQKTLESIVRKAELKDLENVSLRVVAHKSFSEAVSEVAREGFDLILLGAPREMNLRKWLFGTLPDSMIQGEDATVIGAFRKGTPYAYRLAQVLSRTLGVYMPPLTREDRISLYQELQGNARWNFDFFILMFLSTSIAALGLLINSTAVVIGAMLVAPLMLPLLAAGLSLSLANRYLLKQSITAICFGFAVAFVVGMTAGAFAPMVNLNEELLARGRPNFFDLLIALISGFAAAYCTARPNLSAALPGVAIAAALVPPIATAGISLSMGHFDNAAGSTLLFVTNVMAIILGAAASFWLAGARVPAKVVKEHKWLIRVTLTLCTATLILGTTLMGPMLKQYRQHRSSVVRLSATLCTNLDRCLIENEITLIRQSARMQNDHIKLTLNVESDHPIAPETLEQLQHIALAQLKTPVDLDVRIQWVQHYRPTPIPSMNPKR